MKRSIITDRTNMGIARRITYYALDGIFGNLWSTTEPLASCKGKQEVQSTSSCFVLFLRNPILYYIKVNNTSKLLFCCFVARRLGSRLLLLLVGASPRLVSSGVDILSFEKSSKNETKNDFHKQTRRSREQSKHSPP